MNASVKFKFNGSKNYERNLEPSDSKFSYFDFSRLALIKPKTTGFGFVRRLVNSG